MIMPEELLAVARESAEKYGDVKDAISAALRRIKNLPNISALMDKVLYQCVQDLVYEARCVINRRKKVNLNPNNVNTSGRSLVPVGDSEYVMKVCDSMYSYHIGGRLLGDLYGKDIDGLILQEGKIAAGHMVNRDLLKWIKSRGVGKDERVRDKISDKALTNAFRRLLDRSDFVKK